MADAWIDIWSPATFDAELMGFLDERRDLIRDYVTRENEIFLSHDLGRAPRPSTLRPENRYAAGYLGLTEELMALLESRVIRAWHFTRLTDTEMQAFRQEGVHLSTPETLRKRLDTLVAEGLIDTALADTLYAESPFHSDQKSSRSNKFWMTSHPIAIDDSGVVPLMAHWGGEVASMWIKNGSLLAPLAQIGKARVLELAIPLSQTTHSYTASRAALAAFARMLGCVESSHAFDLFVTAPLPPPAVIAVHTEGEAAFALLARGYPDTFIDVDLTHWKNLTGEDD